ncbi:MAG: hypothetical protein WC758_03840 [Candidatus Woesearchaeota archaeon]
MNGKLILSMLFILLILPMVLPSVLSEQSDKDSDGVVDSIDICDFTNSEEGLPVITQNKEYLGCSCSQIYAKIGEKTCFDVFCSTNRPFSIRERTYSSKSLSCGEDYCIGETLYNFSNLTSIPCIAGKEIQFNCSPEIIENSELCINHVIPEYVIQVENITKNTTNLILLDDYEKLEKRVYALISNDAMLKNGLGISRETLFINQIEKTNDVVVVQKSLKTEVRTISNSEKTIFTKTIIIEPESYIKLEKLYVFEELPRGAKIIGSDVIPKTEVILKEESPVLLVWELDEVSKPVELSYQINKPFEGETNTLLVAKKINNNTWKLMFIPLAFIVIIVGIFIFISEKSVPRRKKIFKER